MATAATSSTLWSLCRALRRVLHSNARTEPKQICTPRLPGLAYSLMPGDVKV
jgi:hypothetical protein